MSFSSNFEVREGDICPQMTQVVKKLEKFLTSKSDDATEDEGFEFIWNSTVDSCGGEIQDIEGFSYFFYTFHFLKYGCDRFSKVISLT